MLQPETARVPIAGIHNCSLINYPGRIALCIFTQGCNLCCPYCHNRDLIPSEPGKIDHAELMRYLRAPATRRLINGVVITGGEPTVHGGLPSLIAQIKKENLLVKLDTNGTNPDALQNLVEEGLIDSISMDVKTSLDKYQEYLQVDPAVIVRSIELIAQSGLDYEFRTTIDGELCTSEDLEIIEGLIPDSKHTIQTVRLQHVAGF
ncbi:MAG: anaerobic ribonucleoside-triphosphate reductase activating protein [Pseudomonadota bacterium]